jgi:hypothetical protein
MEPCKTGVMSAMMSGSESAGDVLMRVRLGHRRLAYSPSSQSGVGEIIAARRKKENSLGE